MFDERHFATVIGETTYHSITSLSQTVAAGFAPSFASATRQQDLNEPFGQFGLNAAAAQHRFAASMRERGQFLAHFESFDEFRAATVQRMLREHYRRRWTKQAYHGHHAGVSRRKERNIDAEIFGETVRRLRADRGTTQEQLAELANLNVRYIEFIERGENVPTLTIVMNLAERFMST